MGEQKTIENSTAQVCEEICRLENAGRNLRLAEELARGGYAFFDVGDHSKAMILLQQCEQLITELCGPRTTRQDLAICRGDLAAIAIKHARFAEANEYLRGSLDIYKRMYGPSPIKADVAGIYGTFGSLHTAEGNYKEAHSKLYKALEILKTIYPTQPITQIAFTYDKIGDWYDERNMFDEAYKTYGKAIDMLKKVYPNKNVREGRGVLPSSIALKWIRLHCKRGKLLSKRGFLTKAMAEYHETIPKITKMLEASGDDVIPLAEVHDGVGDVYMLEHNYPRAFREYTTAAQLRFNFYGANTNYQALVDSHCRLGHVCLKRYQFKEALCHYETARDKILKIYKSENHPEAGKILNFIGDLFFEQCNYSKSLTYHSKALEVYEECYRPNKHHRNIAFTYNAIGDVYCELGDYDNSHEYNFKSLEVNKKVFADNLCQNISIAYNYESIGATFLGQGEYKQAQMYFKKMDNIIVELYGETARNLDILRVIYRYAQLKVKKGRYLEGAVQLDAARLVAEEVFHPDSAKYLRELGDLEMTAGCEMAALVKYYAAHKHCLRYNTLRKSQNVEKARIYTAEARIWFRRKNYEEAADDYVTAADRMTEMFGLNANHPELANIAKGQGDVHYAMYQYSQALFSYQLALNIRETVYKENPIHPDIAETFYCLGCTYLQFGQYENSLTHHARARDIRETIHAGVNHRDLARSYDGMGTACQMRQEYDRAREFFKESLKMKQHLKNTDTNCLDIIKSYKLIGNLYNTQRDYNRAVKYHTKAANFSEEISVHDEDSDFRTAECYDNIGIANCNADEWEAARTALQTSGGLKGAAFDKATSAPVTENVKNFIYRTYLQSIANTNWYIGNVDYAEGTSIRRPPATEQELYDAFNSAIESYDLAFSQLESIWPEGYNPNIAAVYTSKGLALQQSVINNSRGDDYSLAMDCHSRALTIREAVYDNATENHPDIATSYKNMGDVYQLQGNVDSAVQCLNTALEKYTKFYNGELVHPEVANVYESLGTTSYVKDDYNKALAHFLKCHEVRVAIYGKYVKHHKELASVHTNLGNVYSKLGQEEESSQHQAMAERIKTGAGCGTQE